jgi:hypothetical protein
LSGAPTGGPLDPAPVGIVRLQAKELRIGTVFSSGDGLLPPP